MKRVLVFSIETEVDEKGQVGRGFLSVSSENEPYEVREKEYPALADAMDYVLHQLLRAKIDHIAAMAELEGHHNGKVGNA